MEIAKNVTNEMKEMCAAVNQLMVDQFDPSAKTLITEEQTRAMASGFVNAAIYFLSRKRNEYKNDCVLQFVYGDYTSREENKFLFAVIAEYTPAEEEEAPGNWSVTATMDPELFKDEKDLKIITIDLSDMQACADINMFLSKKANICISDEIGRYDIQNSIAICVFKGIHDYTLTHVGTYDFGGFQIETTDEGGRLVTQVILNELMKQGIKDDSKLEQLSNDVSSQLGLF